MKKLFFAILSAFVVVGVGCAQSSLNTDQDKTNASSNVVLKDDRLDLSNKELTNVSQDIFTMTDIEDLDLSHNKLTGALPAEIRHLQNLKILNASYNLMTGVPAEIGQLKHLEILDLSHNQITGLPNELGNLKQLKILNLTGNSYSTQDLETIRRSLPTNVEIIL